MNAANQDRTASARLMAGIDWILAHDWALAVTGLTLFACIYEVVK